MQSSAEKRRQQLARRIARDPELYRAQRRAGRVRQKVRKAAGLFQTSITPEMRKERWAKNRRRYREADPERFRARQRASRARRRERDPEWRARRNEAETRRRRARKAEAINAALARIGHHLQQHDGDQP